MITRALFRYWGSKPGNILEEYIKQIPKNGLILDFFGGSGSIVFKALATGHKALYADINPYAFILAYTLITDTNLDKLRKYSNDVIFRVKNLAEHLYKVDINGYEVSVKYFKWLSSRKIVAFTYDGECLECCSNDFSKMYEIALTTTPKRVLEAELMYPNGIPFDKMRYSKKIIDFFTPRNLLILNSIRRAIYDIIVNEEPDINISIPLITAFAAIIYNSSKMARENAGSWGINSYWAPSTHVERNPLILFERAIKRIISWKTRNPRYKICLDIKKFNEGSCYALFYLGSAYSLLEKMMHQGIKIDAVITDPPFTDEVQYFELSYIINVWIHDLLKLVLNGKYRIFSRYYRGEIVVNRKRGMDEKKYMKKLRHVFKLLRQALKSNGKIILLFHEEQKRVHRELIKMLENLGYKLIKTEERTMVQRSIGCRNRKLGRSLKIYILNTV